VEVLQHIGQQFGQIGIDACRQFLAVVLVEAVPVQLLGSGKGVEDAFGQLDGQEVVDDGMRERLGGAVVVPEPERQVRVALVLENAHGPVLGADPPSTHGYAGTGLPRFRAAGYTVAEGSESSGMVTPDGSGGT